MIKKIRISIENWDDTYIYGVTKQNGRVQKIRSKYRMSDGAFDTLPDELYEGAQMNLLSATIEEENGMLTASPQLLVLDPDFLIDITAICQCIKPYGTNVLNHLINKLSPGPRSAAIQLGNLANQFLDACVYERNKDDLYAKTLQQSFETSPIEYTTLPDIDARFFEQAKVQFENICSMVQQQFQQAHINIESQEVQLEPSFLCEALGLQGRLDLLVGDSNKIVELKSGRAEEYPSLAPKKEHALQMALYKEILFYNMDIPHEEVETFLFYSRYPALFTIQYEDDDLRWAIGLRNSIVAMEQKLRQGESESVMELLTEQNLVTPTMRTSRFYLQYLRNDLMNVVARLKNLDEVEKAYFHTFLAFMEREQFLSKTGHDGPQPNGGFADVWNLDTESKQGNGNILTDLTLQPIFDDSGAVTGMDLMLPQYADDFLPNFRPGDSVLLYERNTDTDCATNKQIFRCQIEDMNAQRVRVKLAYKQRQAQVFHLQAHYAIEPGYADSTFAQAYRGLFALLLAPKDRRQLILGQRLPKHDPSVVLKSKPQNPETAEIVLRAKQASDYFLLVGPPGTGKTSVALKAMVEELLQESPKQNLLLMAYTNRAVDEICQMLEGLEGRPEYVRIGQELSCEKEYRHRLIKNKIKNARKRKEIFDLLEPVQVFVGTISSIAGRTELFELKHFHTALVDEASQVLEPQLLPLLCATTSKPSLEYGGNPCAIGKFILIGDHKQLPAVVLQEPECSEVTDEQLRAIGLTNCRNSLFERWHNLQLMMHTEQNTVGWLHRQGRMHENLCDFVNECFYNRKLDLVPLPHQKGCLETEYRGTDRWMQLVALRRMAFVPAIPETDAENARPWTTENCKVNRDEATVTANIVEAFYRLHETENDWNPARKIGVIVPFRGQIAMVRKELAARNLKDCEKITIDTVERYQGSQRDVIVFSTTIRRPEQMDMLSVPVQTEGQWIDRKLNVALTRARKQFFLTGNPHLLNRSDNYRALLEYIEKLNDSLGDESQL